MNKKLLELRKRMKARKPEFIGQDSWKRKEIRKRWQKPRGYHSKLRRRLRGYRKLVTAGYGSPNEVYGLHPSGLEIIRVSSEKDLKNINKETQGALVSGAVGMKKRMGIVKKAKEAGIKILNVNDPDSFLKMVEEDIKKRKEKKAKESENKKTAEKKKPIAKKKEKEAELAEKLSEEDKKEAEKKEKDKLLTRKEI
jgi:large subunit ribosomal protein L32e